MVLIDAVFHRLQEVAVHDPRGHGGGVEQGGVIRRLAKMPQHPHLATSVESRAGDIGTLLALGFTPRKVRRLYQGRVLAGFAGAITAAMGSPTKRTRSVGKMNRSCMYNPNR